MACNQSLPITIDLEVSVTKIQTVDTVDLSTPIFVTPAAIIPPATEPQPQTERVRFYDTLTELQEDFPSGTEAFAAGETFFSQNPRPQSMAVGLVFTAAQSGFLVTAQTGSVAAFQAVTDGAFVVTIDGDTQTISGLDFSTDTEFSDIAVSIRFALQVIGTGGYTLAEVVASNGTQNQFTIKSGTTGASSTLSLLSSPGAGTDISGVGFMNGQNGEVIAGYTPGDFVSELTLIQKAASCAGRFVYGWALDKLYRDTQNQLDAAAWAEPQLFIFLALTSNNPLSYDANDTTNNISLLFAAGYTRTLSFFHDKAQYYPEMGVLAIMLSVDYDGLNTALTLKFKNLIGIPPVSFPEPETNVSVLQSRRANTFVIVGNGARTVRQGVMVSTEWYADDRTNADNFVNDLLTSLYNVFLTTPKVPYDSAGISTLYSAEQKICDQYVRNDFLASRVVPDSTKPNGINTVAAYVIIFPPLQSVTLAERAARQLAGNQLILQPSGAIHSMIINILITS